MCSLIIISQYPPPPSLFIPIISSKGTQCFSFWVCFFISMSDDFLFRGDFDDLGAKERLLCPLTFGVTLHTFLTFLVLSMSACNKGKRKLRL